MITIAMFNHRLEQDDIVRNCIPSFIDSYQGQSGAAWANHKNTLQDFLWKDVESQVSYLGR